MQIERDVVRFLLAALVVAALFDILSPSVGGGKAGASVNLASTGFKGLGGIFARVTGQQPPAGF